jgi:hypothetical protein
MFCPYVISTLYHLLEELQMRTFKRYVSGTILLITLQLREMNQDTIVVYHNWLYFTGTRSLLQQKDRVVLMAQEY